MTTEEWLTVLPSWPGFAALGAITLVAGIMRGFSGFGSGLLMAPVFSLLLAPADMLGVILLLNLLTVFQLLPGALRDVDWRLVLRLFIPSLLGVPLGLVMIHMLDVQLMRKTIAVLVVAVAVVMLRGWYYEGRRGRVQDAMAGALGGLMTAVGGIGGPPLILYLLSDRQISPAIFRAVMIMFLFLSQLATLVPFTLTGSLTVSQLANVMVLLPVYVAAIYLGTCLHCWALHKRQAQARRVCLVFMLGTGVLAFVV